MKYNSQKSTKRKDNKVSQNNSTSSKQTALPLERLSLNSFNKSYDSSTLQKGLQNRQQLLTYQKWCSKENFLNLGSAREEKRPPSRNEQQSLQQSTSQNQQVSVITSPNGSAITPMHPHHQPLTTDLSAFYFHNVANAQIEGSARKQSMQEQRCPRPFSNVEEEKCVSLKELGASQESESMSEVPVEMSIGGQKKRVFADKTEEIISQGNVTRTTHEVNQMLQDMKFTTTQPASYERMQQLGSNIYLDKVESLSSIDFLSSNKPNCTSMNSFITSQKSALIKPSDPNAEPPKIYLKQPEVECQVAAEHSQSSQQSLCQSASSSLSCQCTGCLQQQMTYLQSLLQQQQQLYFQQLQSLVDQSLEEEKDADRTEKSSEQQQQQEFNFSSDCSNQELVANWNMKKGYKDLPMGEILEVKESFQDESHQSVMSKRIHEPFPFLKKQERSTFSLNNTEDYLQFASRKSSQNHDPLSRKVSLDDKPIFNQQSPEIAQSPPLPDSFLIHHNRNTSLVTKTIFNMSAEKQGSFHLFQNASNPQELIPKFAENFSKQENPSEQNTIHKRQSSQACGQKQEKVVHHQTSKSAIDGEKFKLFRVARRQGEVVGSVSRKSSPQLSLSGKSSQSSLKGKKDSIRSENSYEKHKTNMIINYILDSDPYLQKKKTQYLSQQRNRPSLVQATKETIYNSTESGRKSDSKRSDQKSLVTANFGCFESLEQSLSRTQEMERPYAAKGDEKPIAVKRTGSNQQMRARSEEVKLQRKFEKYRPDRYIKDVAMRHTASSQAKRREAVRNKYERQKKLSLERGKVMVVKERRVASVEEKERSEIKDLTQWKRQRSLKKRETLPPVATVREKKQNVMKVEQQQQIKAVNAVPRYRRDTITSQKQRKQRFEAKVFEIKDLTEQKAKRSLSTKKSRNTEVKSSSLQASRPVKSSLSRQTPMYQSVQNQKLVKNGTREVTPKKQRTQASSLNHKMSLGQESQFEKCRTMQSMDGRDLKMNTDVKTSLQNPFSSLATSQRGSVGVQQNVEVEHEAVYQKKTLDILKERLGNCLKSQQTPQQVQTQVEKPKQNYEFSQILKQLEYSSNRSRCSENYLYSKNSKAQSIGNNNSKMHSTLQKQRTEEHEDCSGQKEPPLETLMSDCKVSFHLQDYRDSKISSVERDCSDRKPTTQKKISQQLSSSRKFCLPNALFFNQGSKEVSKDGRMDSEQSPMPFSKVPGTSQNNENSFCFYQESSEFCFSKASEQKTWHRPGRRSNGQPQQQKATLQRKESMESKGSIGTTSRKRSRGLKLPEEEKQQLRQRIQLHQSLTQTHDQL